MFLQDALDFLPILLKGAVVTVQVTAGSFVLSSLIGLVFALMMVSKIRAVALFAIGVVNVIRGLPIIVQLFYIYFVLPDFGIQLSAMQAGVIGLKTGVTDIAGYCFVGLCRSRKGNTYISVTLGGPTSAARWRDSKILLTYAYKKG